MCVQLREFPYVLLLLIFFILVSAYLSLFSQANVSSAEPTEASQHKSKIVYVISPWRARAQLKSCSDRAMGRYMVLKDCQREPANVPARGPVYSLLCT